MVKSIPLLGMACSLNKVVSDVVCDQKAGSIKWYWWGTSRNSTETEGC